jgi:hypothetical protein
MPLAFGNDNGWCGMYQLGTSSTEFWGFTKWSFLEMGSFSKPWVSIAKRSIPG